MGPTFPRKLGKSTQKCRNGEKDMFNSQEGDPPEIGLKHETNTKSSSWWLNHPTEKYARQNGNFLQFSG